MGCQNATNVEDHDHDRTLVGRCIDPRPAVMFCKRKMKRLFWRIRAEIKRRRRMRQNNKNIRRGQKFCFSYDPLSYALNFDNGDFGFFC